MISIYKFYRLDFCIRNLGLGFIAILSVSQFPPILKSALAILQILLAQMYSFSMNNYYDTKVWGEENYAKELMNKGFSDKAVWRLCALPLILMLLTIPFSNASYFLLILYQILFHLYQAPGFRYKDNYILSLIINSVCLGTILFLYPFWFLESRVTPIAVILSVIFFFYLAFFELFHQVEHLGKDRIQSLPQIKGIPFTAKASAACLLIAIAFALYGISMDPRGNFFLIGVLLFSSARIVVLLKSEKTQELFRDLRNRKDRFFAIQEGLFFAFFLLMGKLWK